MISNNLFNSTFYSIAHMIKKKIFISCSLFSFMFVASLMAEIPKTIYFQAHIVDEHNNSINKNINLIVKLYDDLYSMNAVYINNIADRNVYVENGFLSYYIKDIYGVKFDKQLWAELTIDGNVLNDRIPLAPTPYSLYASEAKISDTANFAKGLANNSVTTNHLTDGAVKGINIEDNQISADKLILDDNYNWRGYHTYRSSNVEMELNRKGYAINVIKGTVKISVAEVDTLNTINVVAENVFADAFITNKYVIKENGNDFFIGNNSATYDFGIILKDGILNYVGNVVFNNSSENNSIVNKKYLDDKINELLTTVGIASNEIINMFEVLDVNKLLFWDGNKITTSSLFFNKDKTYYTEKPIFTNADSLAIINKGYVDALNKSLADKIEELKSLLTDIENIKSEIESFDEKLIDLTNDIENNFIKNENESVKKDHISDNAITTEKIIDAAVTEDKIATESVTDSKINVTQIEYKGNITSDLMPENPTNATVTTKKYVDEKIEGLESNFIKNENESVKNTHISDNAITTEKINDEAITDDKINVTQIEYKGNTTTDLMPENPTDATLTTKKYVDDAIKNIKNDDTDEQSAITLNNEQTALHIEKGNVIFSYINVEANEVAKPMASPSTNTYLDLSDYGNYSVINITGAVSYGNNKVLLPTDGVQPGQILYITSESYLDYYNAIDGSDIANTTDNNKIMSFVAILTSTGIRWASIK